MNTRGSLNKETFSSTFLQISLHSVVLRVHRRLSRKLKYCGCALKTVTVHENGWMKKIYGF